jgi:hypothetical protein
MNNCAKNFNNSFLLINRDVLANHIFIIFARSTNLILFTPMKAYLFAGLFLLSGLVASAQIYLAGYSRGDINPELFDGLWKARWISVPDEPANVYGVYHFRKSFELKEAPAKFVVHVSADNRYKLYVNGHFVSLGPARGDVYNWNFATVDIAQYLTTGKNTLAAVVWNYAERKPVAQISFNQTGFIIQGNTTVEEAVNTNETWLCLKDEAYTPWDGGTVLGYFVVGPGECVNASAYPWGWELPAYDDSHWKKAHSGIAGAIKGARDYPGRQLTPSPLPPMEMKQERLAKVVTSEGITCPKEFLKQPVQVVVPAHSSVRLLLDNELLTTGYLSFLYSRGKNAEIRIGYA